MKRILLFVLLFGFLPFSANAGVKCSDVKYGSENYHEKMEELAKLARLPDGYYNRYHEDVVRDLCEGNAKGIRSSIDSGSVKRSEVEAIKEALDIDNLSTADSNSSAALEPVIPPQNKGV